MSSGGPYENQSTRPTRGSGRAERCFLKHYCVNVAGVDLSAEVEDAAGAAGRRLLLAASVLYSAAEGRWTTDRAGGAEMLAARHPDLADEVGLVMAWSRSSHGGAEVTASAQPGPRRADVADMLNRLGSRIQRDIVRLLAS